MYNVSAGILPDIYKISSIIICRQEPEPLSRTPEYRYRLHIQADRILFESLDRVKLETRRKSALFQRRGEEIALKGVLSRLKISEGLSEKLPLLSYLGIIYMNHEVVAEVINWFEKDIDFLNYGNPQEELKTAVAASDDVRKLVLDMIKEMDLDIEDFRVEHNDNYISGQLNIACHFRTKSAIVASVYDR